MARYNLIKNCRFIVCIGILLSVYPTVITCAVTTSNDTGAPATSFNDMLNAVIEWQSQPASQAICGTDADGKLAALLEKFDTCTSAGESFRIVNGCNVSAADPIPWQVLVYFTKGSICGGNLVTNRHVTLAAHCFENVTSTKSMKIFIGATDMSENRTAGTKYKVANFARHPLWDTLTTQNDWGLLELAEEIPFLSNGTGPRPVCLPTRPSTAGEKRCILAGHGLSDAKNNLGAGRMRYTLLDIIDPEQCKEYPNFHANNAFCAIGMRAGNATDSCGGDSGSGLCCRVNGKWTLRGVVSYGVPECGTKPGVYADAFVGLDMKHNAARIKLALSTAESTWNLTKQTTLGSVLSFMNGLGQTYRSAASESFT